MHQKMFKSLRYHSKTCNFICFRLSIVIKMYALRSTVCSITTGREASQELLCCCEEPWTRSHKTGSLPRLCNSLVF